MSKKVTNLHALSRSLFLTSTLKIGFIGEKQKNLNPKNGIFHLKIPPRDLQITNHFPALTA